VKQSSAAPPAGALLLRFRAEAASFAVETGGWLGGAVILNNGDGFARQGG